MSRASRPRAERRDDPRTRVSAGPRRRAGRMQGPREGAEPSSRAGAGSPFAAGTAVVLYLREPPAKVWGVLRSLDATGAAVEGIDLRSFDEWLRGVAAGEIGPEDVSMAFYPLPRIDKILLDRGSEASPSLSDQFQSRVGRSVQEFLGPPGKKR